MKKILILCSVFIIAIACKEKTKAHDVTLSGKTTDKNIDSTLSSEKNPKFSGDTHKFAVELAKTYMKKVEEAQKKTKQFAEQLIGKPSPVFENYENNAGGTTSLTDLKGKYVYIDVWATWCGPCKVEIPFLKEVEKKYHGKNIEFVSISVDKAKDHDKWKKIIEDKEMGGVQLFADKDFSSDFVKGYGIKGIPRFILIDPEGNIINADAPRPSNPKLIELFNEYKI